MGRLDLPDVQRDEDEYKPIETLRGRGYRLAVARGAPPSG